MALTVGFDLDMTLLDTRPGIRATYDVLAAETGTAIDSGLAVSRLGPPLVHELAHWFPAERVEAVADRYRELYREHALHGTVVLPGAREAVAAVRALGGRVAVITGKYERNARLQLDHVGLTPDILVGDLWAETKGTRCASTAPASTSATTSGTSSVPGPRAPSRSRSPPARTAPGNCGRPAPTWC
ncbi:hypothetical protein GCM10025734_48700 [Kitasatospora paranensis]